MTQAGFAPNAPAGGGIDHINSEQVSYLNNNDLGFGRRMTMRIDKSTGSVFAFVTNFGQNDQCVFNADNAHANKTPGPTVAMEFSPLGNVAGKVVKFFVYGPTSADPAKAVLLNSANLDGTVRYVPNLCVTCHGGLRLPAGTVSLTPAQASLRFDLSNPLTGAHFREFDLASFRYPSGTHASPTTHVPTDPTLLGAFNHLNHFVLKASPTPAIEELINKWYAKPGSYDPDAIPSGWNKHSDLYTKVVAKACRTCHVAIGNGNSIDWASYDKFDQFRGSIKAFVCSGPASRLMPHALITYRNFWNSSPSQPATLGSFSATDWSAFGGCN